MAIPAQRISAYSHNRMHTCSPAPKGPVIAVIPAYNEEDTIGSIALTAREYVDYVIIVDDGSTDRTSEIASLTKADVIRLPANQGKAAAIFEGLARARSLHPRAVVLLDGDGQHNPCEIPQVIAPVLDEEVDMVIGSRALETGNGIPKYRRIGQKTLDMVTNIGSPVKTTDSQSGFRALGPRCLDHVDFPSSGYNIESDMFHYFVEKGLSIAEVGITVKYDVNHAHKTHPVSHGIDVLGHIIGLIGYRRPLATFGIPGFLLTVMGLVTGSFAFSEYYLTTRFPYLLSMVSALFLILGLLLVTTALILNSLTEILKHQS